MTAIKKNKTNNGFKLITKSRLFNLENIDRLNQPVSFLLDWIFLTMIKTVAINARMSAIMSIANTLDHPVGTINPVKNGPSAAPEVR